MTATDRTRDALAALEAAMESADYPARQHLAPGAPEEHIRDALAPTGLTVPDEVIQLWRWHNGRTRRSLQGEGDTWELPGGYDLLSVEAAVRDWTWTRDNHPWGQLVTLEPTWLPIATRGNATVWADCAAPEGPAPVRLAYPEDTDRSEVDARAVASVARLVELWTIALDQGIWRLVRPGEQWTGPDGRAYALQIDHPRWELDDRHPDLPPDWPG